MMKVENMKEVRVVVFVRLWKADDRFIARAERPGSELLMKYVGSKAVARISGLNVEFRTAITQWNRGTVVLTLPAALNPTWERLWRRNERLIVELTIEENEETKAVGEAA